jgi:addiction module HigA family antidote
MAMKNPVHPGCIVREDCLAELGLSVTEAARHLGIGRAALSALVNERASVSIEMAYRLSKAFGSTPDHWMRMQLAYDLAQGVWVNSGSLDANAACLRFGAIAIT